MFPSLSKILVIVGIVFLVLAGIVYLAGRINLPLGKLPGDITIQGKNLTCFIPLATSIILSILLSVVLTIISRFMGRK
jgi:hypothetical protein